MRVITMNDYSALITEFSNPTRVKLLLLLDDQKATSSELTRRVGGISNSEVSRHLARLGKEGLVTKESVSGRIYELTPFGTSVVSAFGPLHFIFSHGDYFKTHRIDFLPVSLIRGIDALKNAEFISGTGNAMMMMEQFMELPMNELFLMSDNVFPFSFACDTVHFIIPPSVLEHAESMRREVRFPDRRVLQDIPLSLALTDTGHGGVFFPSYTSQGPDYSEGFAVSDPTGIAYLQALWSYFWNLEDMTPGQS
jgi:DNA-binding transcriptional ArsR family regulator